ncbi:putative Retrovirus-related Pol polyprotein [Hypsibius exemplaris]|uniref:Retrovirus-related Pol polyprotein n=1 Tax=Hypsibius exemplaris TaxID=2072580 RepID=A0A1W0WMB9_HYPEX|nr:putative Retrovirus-related Pol polyprotein [Hypsibius exemplaris]
MEFIVSRTGLEADGSKIDAVKNFPRPKNAKHARSFVGLCVYYKRFVKGFSDMACPLNRLAKKDVPFRWGDEEETAFQRLKDAMVSPPVLVNFNVDLPVEIHPDASAYAMGVVLVQRDDQNRERVIAYGSASMNAAQRNYSTTQRECLAIVWTCEKYRYYLLGREVTCYTDHHSLCWLFNFQSPSSLLVRVK